MASKLFEFLWYMYWIPLKKIKNCPPVNSYCSSSSTDRRTESTFLYSLHPERHCVFVCRRNKHLCKRTQICATVLYLWHVGKYKELCTAHTQHTESTRSTEHAYGVDQVQLHQNFEAADSEVFCLFWKFPNKLWLFRQLWTVKECTKQQPTGVGAPYYGYKLLPLHTTSY